jgi:hypothetical protein
MVQFNLAWLAIEDGKVIPITQAQYRRLKEIACLAGAIKEAYPHDERCQPHDIGRDSSGAAFVPARIG